MQNLRLPFSVLLLAGAIAATEVSCHQRAIGQIPPPDAIGNTSAQVPEKVFQRFDLFQMLLEERGLVPVQNPADVLTAPAESAIVIAGHPLNVPDKVWRGYLSFVQGGGTLLVLDERVATIPGVGRFRAGPVITHQSSDSYQGHDDCVTIRLMQDPNSLLQGVSTLVTNRSNWFEPAFSSWFAWQILARFPDDCEPVSSQGQPLLAIGLAQGRDSGVIIVAADASLLTNGMLWHGDNATLAIRIAEILAGSSKGRLYFVDNGRVLGSYREQLGIPSKKPPTPATMESPGRPNMQTLLKFANAVAKDAINSGILNETLRQRPRSWTAADYFQGLVGGLTLIGLVWVLWRLATHRPIRPIFPGFRRMISAYEMRNLVGNGPGDYHNPAAHLAREFCLELTGTRLSAEWQKYLGRLMVVAQRLSRTEQDALKRIFDIASRGCREKMNGSEFQQLGKTIADLRRNHLENLRLAMSESPFRG